MMEESAGPLEDRLKEIEAALTHHLYYLAVTMALTMPDVCAALEDEIGYSGNREYQKWYNENLKDKFFMSSEQCYSLRCGMVHKANMTLKTKEKTPPRVIFTLPAMLRLHNNILDDALQFDVVEFCKDVISSVRSWYTRCKDDPNVKANIGRVVRIYPSGLSPYVLGVPVIA